MYQIAYTSRATSRPSRGSLNKLCEQSSTYNESAGITRLLVFDRIRYMQVIEGERQAVQQLMSRIEVDNRHEKVTHIADHIIKRRAFDGWTLACVRFGENENCKDFIADVKDIVGNVSDVRLKAVFIGFAALSK